ncbi:MAG: tetratricopeptide repeat protein [Deltaproteobacteria bacterium]|nr:tetratricopeptide repeat protein [Deltaproteobacteria bacterium]
MTTPDPQTETGNGTEAPRRDTVRLSRPGAGATILPPALRRLRSTEDGELDNQAEQDAADPLELPQDPVVRQAEERMALADSAGALELGERLRAQEPPGDEGELTDPGAAARSVMARALLMEGRADQARAALGRHRSDARRAAADAALLLSEGRLAEARGRVQAALTRHPAGVTEHHVLALLRATEGDMDEAMRLLKRVAANVQSHAVVRHQLGRLVAAAGDPARAGTLFEMAMELAPTFAAPALALAEMFVESRQYGEAMNILAETTARAPQLLAPRLLQLRILLENRRTAQALELGEALMKAAPGHEEVTVLWAEALLQARRGDQARGALEGLAVSGNGAQVVRLRRLLARVALQAEPERVSEALGHLEVAARGSPRDGELLLELAELQVSAGRIEDVADTLTRLLDADMELGTLLSATVMAQKNGMAALGQRLTQSAMARVAGTPLESQLRSLLGTE